MPLSQGRTYLAIPGPSVIPDAVLREMHRASPNIYEGALAEGLPHIVKDLLYVARAEKANVAMYICNGHGVWDASLANVVAPGEKILVLSTGRFGGGWAAAASARGIDVQILDFGTKSTFDMAQVSEVLAADKAREFKAVLVTHVDTSSSIRNDLVGIRQALDDLDHPALLMADCVASLGCEEFRFDDWGIDIAVTASQKGLMTPPGLGFVYFSDRAAAQRKAMKSVSRYWDWAERAEPEAFYQYFGGTPPVNHIFGLKAALGMIRDEGIEQVWTRHAQLAQAVWAAAEHWGSGNGALRLNITDRSLRSHAVTSMGLGLPYGEQLRKWCDSQAGVTLGIGLGMSEPNDPMGRGFFRFGHMGHVNAQMIFGLLGTVEAGLAAIGAPHESGGVAAAAKIIADACPVLGLGTEALGFVDV